MSDINIKKLKYIESVLYICTCNAVRSPIAECLTKRICGERVYVDSVGIAGSLSKVNPFAVSAMEETGFDLSTHTPKHYKDLDDTSFDLIICLSEEAYQAIKKQTGSNTVDVEYWPIFDPTTVTGNRENIMTSFRKIRDELEVKIKNRNADYREARTKFRELN